MKTNLYIPKGFPSISTYTINGTDPDEVSRIDLGMKLRSINPTTATTYELEPLLPHSRDSYDKHAARLWARSACLGDLRGKEVFDIRKLCFLFDKVDLRTAFDSRKPAGVSRHPLMRYWMDTLSEDFGFTKYGKRSELARDLISWYVDGGSSLLPRLSEDELHEYNESYIAEMSRRQSVDFSSDQYDEVFELFAIMAEFRGLDLEEMLLEIAHLNITVEVYEYYEQNRKKGSQDVDCGLITSTLSDRFNVAHRSIIKLIDSTCGIAFQAPRAPPTGRGSMGATRVDLVDPNINSLLERIFEHFEMDGEYFMSLIANEKRNAALWRLHYTLAFNAGAYPYSFNQWELSISKFKDRDANRYGDGVNTRYSWRDVDELALVGQAAIHRNAQEQKNLPKTTITSDVLLKALRANGGMVDAYGSPTQDEFPSVSKVALHSHIHAERVRLGAIMVDHGVEFDALLHPGALKELDNKGLCQSMSPQEYRLQAGLSNIDDAAQWKQKKIAQLANDGTSGGGSNAKVRKARRPAPTTQDLDKIASGTSTSAAPTTSKKRGEIITSDTDVEASGAPAKKSKSKNQTKEGTTPGPTSATSSTIGRPPGWIGTYDVSVTRAKKPKRKNQRKTATTSAQTSSTPSIIGRPPGWSGTYGLSVNASVSNPQDEVDELDSS